MRRTLVFFGLALAGSAGAGWLTSPRAETAPAQAVLVDARPLHAGAVAAEARGRLAQLGLFAPIAEDALEAPPPPDIALLFRRDLTAIEQRPEGPIVWIVDYSAEFGRRGLEVGDVYQDGWRVAAVAPAFIELRRRRETRQVMIFAPTPRIDP